MDYWEPIIDSCSMFMITCVIYHRKVYIFLSQWYVKCQKLENEYYLWPKKYEEVEKYVMCHHSIYKQYYIIKKNKILSQLINQIVKIF